MVNQRGIEANPEKIKALIEMKSQEDQRMRQKIPVDTECETAFQALKEHLGHAPLLSKPKAGEPLLLYLAVSEESVSSVLVREEEHQLPVYYVSKALLGAEARYPDMEKLALSLITASRKLALLLSAQHPCPLQLPSETNMQKTEASEDCSNGPLSSANLILCTSLEQQSKGRPSPIL
ncbi:Ribonuclease H [Abeliophyllum distichum]|uniref:Ribonuclease H n=1 Tax=Abeliophyllum distichum TaxID=126358 RepID=A0ABD1SVM7_9LAMI